MIDHCIHVMEYVTYIHVTFIDSSEYMHDIVNVNILMFTWTCKFCDQVYPGLSNKMIVVYVH